MKRFCNSNGLTSALRCILREKIWFLPDCTKFRILPTKNVDSWLFALLEYLALQKKISYIGFFQGQLPQICLFVTLGKA
jgi:hypothetical protein